MSWEVVKEFEKKVAEFFGAPFSVSTDSCTHAVELCLRYRNVQEFFSPTRTYVSIPMLAEKLNIKRNWVNISWEEKYMIGNLIWDAAVLWRPNSYMKKTFMCISFQFQKHLNLNRGGIILCDNQDAANDLRKMAYDGREFGIPWRDQDIKTLGFHYYMPIETAALGLQKLPEAIVTPARKWDQSDYPDVSKFSVFNK